VGTPAGARRPRVIYRHHLREGTTQSARGPQRAFQSALGWERGCIAGRMQAEFHHGLLGRDPAWRHESRRLACRNRDPRQLVLSTHPARLASAGRRCADRERWVRILRRQSRLGRRQERDDDSQRAHETSHLHRQFPVRLSPHRRGSRRFGVYGGQLYNGSRQPL
jgi:hypothetical protein